jgi:hypothetical protein
MHSQFRYTLRRLKGGRHLPNHVARLLRELRPGTDDPMHVRRTANLGAAMIDDLERRIALLTHRAHEPSAPRPAGFTRTASSDASPATRITLLAQRLDEPSAPRSPGFTRTPSSDAPPVMRYIAKDAI